MTCGEKIDNDYLDKYLLLCAKDDVGYMPDVHYYLQQKLIDDNKDEGSSSGRKRARIE